GAPRAEAVVSGVYTEVIFDTGCTSNIVSLDLIRKLKITCLEDAGEIAIVFADGQARRPVGFIRDLIVSIGNFIKEPIDAYVYDTNQQYDFILGRLGMHKLKIGIDWSAHFWYSNTENRGVVPIKVYYHKKRSISDVFGDGSDTSSDSPLDTETEDESSLEEGDSEEAFYLIPCEEGQGEFTFVNPETKESTLVRERTSKELNNHRLEPTLLTEPRLGQDDRLGTLLDRIKLYDHLTPAHKERLLSLVMKYSTCFGTSYSHLKVTNLVKFCVDTGDSKPIYNRPYAFIPLSERDFMRKELQEMVEAGVLIPTTHTPDNSSGAGWSFPCRYIKKANGQRRLITNFIGLNQVTKRDTWPMNNTVDVIECLSGSKVYSSLDML
ncbi:uncharacterized protein EV154DRAFT_399167, partial [Mucor mucedo]|uniref:uncharacterized protein n=1 Tax=Mucor mucedo TaxID=29922 RepID=UPI0022207074